MRILQVASEAFPLVKTGGLADVTAGLSQALVRSGDEVRLLMPAYPGVAEAAEATPGVELGDPLGTGPCRLLVGRLPETDVEVWLLDAPQLFARPGGPYLDATGHDHADNALRFGLLGRVGALLGPLGPALGWTPDVVHAHDWQAALAPVHSALWGGRRPGTVLTIHNLRFQGRFDPAIMPSVGLPPSAYSVDGVECYGSASFLKGGIYYADRVSTVSPTYAREIQEQTGGEGLHGLLRTRRDRLHGLVNGIDDTLWNPATDRALARCYDADHLELRADNKAALQRRMGLAVDPRAPLVGWVSRLTEQKGVDLLLGALERLLARGAQVAVVGSGEGALEQALAQAARANPGRFGFFRGYDEALSRTVFGGADLFAVPSRFEPCGLTQLYALRYGAIPVVRHTGGLLDTVPDVDRGGIGFAFDAVDARALADAFDRALDLYARPPRWRALQRRAMAREHGWASVADGYRELYARAIADASSMKMWEPVASDG